jgi:hypothetical protein
MKLKKRLICPIVWNDTPYKKACETKFLDKVPLTIFIRDVSSYAEWIFEQKWVAATDVSILDGLIDQYCCQDTY